MNNASFNWSHSPSIAQPHSMIQNGQGNNSFFQQQSNTSMFNQNSFNSSGFSFLPSNSDGSSQNVNQAKELFIQKSSPQSMSLFGAEMNNMRPDNRSKKRDKSRIC